MKQGKAWLLVTFVFSQYFSKIWNMEWFLDVFKEQVRNCIPSDGYFIFKITVRLKLGIHFYFRRYSSTCRKRGRVFLRWFCWRKSIWDFVTQTYPCEYIFFSLVNETVVTTTKHFIQIVSIHKLCESFYKLRFDN